MLIDWKGTGRRPSREKIFLIVLQIERGLTSQMLHLKNSASKETTGFIGDLSVSSIILPLFIMCIVLVGCMKAESGAAQKNTSLP